MENEVEKETTTREIGYCKPPISPGRTAGVANKVTQQAREAMARIAEGNVERLQDWLNMVADGYKYVKPNGDEVLIPPNPERAADLLLSLMEYHIPKLKSIEIKQPVDPNAPTPVRVYKFVKHDGNSPS